MPLTMSGVPSNLYSGRVPRLSVLKRQETSSLLKFSALIWSSGEYLVPARSPVYWGHSPFFVEWAASPALVERTDVPFLVSDWPDTLVVIHTTPRTSGANARMDRQIIRDISVHLRFVMNNGHGGVERGYGRSPS